LYYIDYVLGSIQHGTDATVAILQPEVGESCSVAGDSVGPAAQCLLRIDWDNLTM
jgi:hypothetical protein